MAIDLVNASDRFQLRLLVPMLLLGLLAAEPCFLLAEDLDGEWLRVVDRLRLRDQLLREAGGLHFTEAAGHAWRPPLSNLSFPSVRGFRATP